MTAPVILRRYVVKDGARLEGWAIFVIGSDGYFSSVSDFGNYAYWWSNPGCEFRRFLTRAAEDPGYFITKLSPGMEYDGEATEKAIRDLISEKLAAAEIKGSFAEDELELLDDADLSSREGLALWHRDTGLSDEELIPTFQSRHPYMVVRFVNEAMGRLAAVLKAELDAEVAQISEVT